MSGVKFNKDRGKNRGRKKPYNYAIEAKRKRDRQDEFDRVLKILDNGWRP